MTKIISLAIVALALAMTSCSNGSNDAVSENVWADTVKLVSQPDTTFLSEYEKEERVKEKNRAISKSQEIPTGSEDFQKLVDYIWKYGFTFTCRQNNTHSGKQYTFFDSDGNRHAFLAVKVDPITKEPSMTGVVDEIFVYGYYNGVKDQEHFFPYSINSTSVYCPILEINGTWEGVNEVTLGYSEFLDKVKSSR